MSCLANGTQRLTRTTNIPTTALTVCTWAICAPAPIVGDTAISMDSGTNYQGQFFVNFPNNNSNWWFFSDDAGNIDLGIISTTWTFLCFSRQNNTNNGIQIYTGTGGTLTKTSPTFTGASVTGTQLTVFGEQDGAVPFHGNVLATKLWDTILTDNEVDAEYRRMQPVVQLANLNTFLPILNNANAALDWSGNGRNMTQTGTFADSRSMPPIPWRGWSGVL